MSNNELMQLDQLRGLGEIFVTSGFFADSKDASQAIVKILAGRELGFGPIASMTGVYIVNGRPALSANLIAARIKGSGRYDYRVKELDNQKCSIEFFNVENHRAPESLGISTFSLEDARKAGTKNLDRYPRNMLFARTLTNGARWYCPDVFNGGIYTPDELGASVDEDGSVIEMPTVAAEPAKLEQPATPPPGYVPPAEKVRVPSHENGNGDAATTLRDLVKKLTPPRQPDTDFLKKSIQTTQIRFKDTAVKDDAELRHMVVRNLFPHTMTGSLTELEPGELFGLRDWLQTQAAKDYINQLCERLLGEKEKAK